MCDIRTALSAVCQRALPLSQWLHSRCGVTTMVWCYDDDLSRGNQPPLPSSHTTPPATVVGRGKGAAGIEWQARTWTLTQCGLGACAGQPELILSYAPLCHRSRTPPQSSCFCLHLCTFFCVVTVWKYDEHSSGESAKRFAQVGDGLSVGPRCILPLSLRARVFSSSFQSAARKTKSSCWRPN